MHKSAFAALLLAALPAGALAETPADGSWEVVFSQAAGGVEATDGETTFAAGTRLGYFLNANHEVGFALDVAATEDVTLFDVGGFYRYNFVHANQSSWWYAGLDLDLVDVSGEVFDDSPILVRPHFGWKNMLSSDVALDINIGHAIDMSDNELDDTTSAEIGLTIFFH